MQIFGFLVLFVSSVAVVLVPTFKGGVQGTGQMEYLFLGIMVLFQIFITLGIFYESDRTVYFGLASILLLAYGLRYSFLMMRTIRTGSRKFDLSDQFILLSCAALLLTGILFLSETLLSNAIVSTGLLYIVLYGFVGSVILGVSIRVTPVLISKDKNYLLTITFYALFLGVVSSVGVAIADVKSYYPIPAALMLISGLCYSSARVLLFFNPGVKLATSAGKSSLIDLAIVSYARLAIAVSIVWLIAGLIFGVLWTLTPGRAAYEILFIHSMGIGFIGSTIMGYAPLLLPGIISAKASRKTMKPFSLIAVNLGLVLMLSGFAFLGYSSAIATIFLSGIFLILAGLAWYLLDIHLHIFLLEDKAAVVFTDDW